MSNSYWIGSFIIINLFAFLFYTHALQRIPSTEYQIMYLFSPIIVAILAFLILTESLHLKYFIGGSIVALGVYITIR